MSPTTEANPSSALAGTKFGSHLLQLVGEPFLFVRRSYGDEVVLHFGDRMLGPARTTKYGEFRYEHGTYSLCLRGSAWVIKAGHSPSVITGGLQADLGEVLGEPTRPANVATEVTMTPGARVTAVIPFPVERPPVKGIGVRIELSDGSSVIAVPTPDEPHEPAPEGATLYEIADWELRTPHGTLQIGPGMKWHFAIPRDITSPHTGTQVAG
jgi:hypothetical protein